MLLWPTVWSVGSKNKSNISSPEKIATPSVTNNMSIKVVDSTKDAVNTEVEVDVDLDFLIKDEIEAIDGYRKMIAKTSNPKLLSVLSHILDEETEHVEELRAAQAGVYEVEDD